MKKSALSLLIGGLFTCTAVYAEEPQKTAATENDTNEQAVTLDTILVSDQPFSQQIGTQKITATQIATMPSRNGNITELLRANPNVTFSQLSNTSTTAGDIRPDEVSFHGEKYYNNNFIIDGMSNNDNLNPAGSLYDPGNRNAYGLPEGGTQSIWLDTGLVESVEVFDSNVGAKYGNFTGGVVDAKLKDPDFTRSNTGKLYYRTTRDSWASFHIDEDKRETFNSATRLDQQPKYTKHIYGFNVSQKFSDNFALRLAYSKTISDIKYYHPSMRYVDNQGNPVGGSIAEPQKRENETLMARAVYVPTDNDTLRLTAIYSPHEARLTRPNIMNGSFKTIGGGVQVNLEWERQADWGKMKSYIGYKKTGDTVENDAQDYHNYRYITGRFGWRNNNLSSIGGYGKVHTEKTIYTAKQDFDLTALDLWSMQHKLSFGWAVDYAIAKYQRDSNSSNYTYTASSQVQCHGADNCFDGEQYASGRLYYAPRTVRANDTDIAAYIQDQINWQRLEMTAGLRLDRNQFMGNTNLAPRLSVSYDVFGDQSTRIFGGANRYYAGSILAYKLRQGIGENERSERTLDNNGVLSDWTAPRSGAGNVPTHYMNNKVKTPFTDEAVFGVTQKFLNADWTFKWVNRRSRDGFVSALRNVDGRVYRTLANTGRGQNDSYTITINPLSAHKFKYAEINWSFSARRSVSKKNNSTTYDNYADDSSRAIYNGRLLDLGELPNNDFNSPWGLSLGLQTKFPDLNLVWQQNFSFIQGREYYEVSESQVDCSASHNRTACGDYTGMATEYRDAKAGSEFNIDWRFIYTLPTFKDQALEISLDVNNVLNRKTIAKSASGTNTYKMGRNFWLGVSYNW